ncbi:MAG: AI-2E family transporter [Hyphomicrobiaceae bacterium]
MRLRQQALAWLGVVAAALLLVALLNGILLPFVAGIVIAYALNPVVDRIERLGLSRVWATLALIVGLAVLAALALVFLVPLVADQLAALIEALPGIYERLRALADQASLTWLGKGAAAGSGDPLGGFDKGLTDTIGSVLTSLLSGGLAFINFLGLLAVTPVVAFYLLVDWHDLVRGVDNWLPRQHAPRIRALASEIDGKLAAFFRGQALVCLIMGTYYAAALSLAGLKYGLLIGLCTGLAGFIPLVGSILAGLVALAMAISQFWPDWAPVALVAGVFAFGQVLDGNVMSPRIVGGSVGLHPVWIIFAVFSFGYLFGFVGMLVAVPAAAAIGVLVRFALDEYRESLLYRGMDPVASGPNDPATADGASPDADGALP